MAILKNSSNSLYLDSNVIIYYKEEGSLHHKKALNLIEESVKKQLTITVSSLTLDESIHGIIRDFKIKKESDVFQKAKSLIKEFLKLPGLEIVNSPTDIKGQLRVFGYMEKYNLRPRDAYHLLIVSSNKIKYFATFDNDFTKVFEAKILKRFE